MKNLNEIRFVFSVLLIVTFLFALVFVAKGEDGVPGVPPGGGAGTNQTIIPNATNSTGGGGGGGGALMVPPFACNGQWNYCKNAYEYDNKYSLAFASGVYNKTGIWYYNFSRLPNATLDRVKFIASFNSNYPNGFANLQVSVNGGKTYGPSNIIGGNTINANYSIDVMNDTSLDRRHLENSDVRVRATCFKRGDGPNPVCHLDRAIMELVFRFP